MEDIRQDNVLPFDTCFCNNHIRMLKVLVPFMDSSLQKYLTLFIKYLEIRYIIECFNHPILLKGTCFDTTTSKTTMDFSSILDRIIPLCSPEQREQFLHIRNLFETFINLQDMLEIMENMKDLFPDGMENIGDISSMFGMGDMNALFHMMDEISNNQ